MNAYQVYHLSKVFMYLNYTKATICLDKLEPLCVIEADEIRASGFPQCKVGLVMLILGDQHMSGSMSQELYPVIDIWNVTSYLVSESP